jgi:hypothetical protein
VFGLALLKNALLFATYAFTWAALALAPGTGAGRARPPASLLLLPQIAWESQRDLTHTVLVTAAAAATLWLAIGLLQRPSTAALRAGLGVALAAGALAKYSFLLVGRSRWPPPPCRPAACAPRCSTAGSCWSVAVAVLLVGAARAVAHRALARRDPVTAGKLELRAGQRRSGMRSAAWPASPWPRSPASSRPLWIVYAALFGRALWRERPPPRRRPVAAFFGRYFALLGRRAAAARAGGAGKLPRTAGCSRCCSARRWRSWWHAPTWPRRSVCARCGGCWPARLLRPAARAWSARVGGRARACGRATSTCRLAPLGERCARAACGRPAVVSESSRLGRRHAPRVPGRRGARGRSAPGRRRAPGRCC